MSHVHVCVDVDPVLSSNPPLPHDNPDRFFLNFVYTAHAMKVDSQGVHHGLIDYKAWDIPCEDHIFLLPEHEVWEDVLIIVEMMGVPPQIKNLVVQKIIEKGMRMAAAGSAEAQRVSAAVARVQVQVRNWEGDDALLSAWRLREFDAEAMERVLAEFAERDEFHGCPASSSAIDALERRKFGDVEEEDEVKCIICLDDIIVGSSMLRMPCMHDFHEPCLLQWLKQHHVCPLCRHQLPKES